MVAGSTGATHGTLYGVEIINEANGGTGQALNSAIFIDDINMSGGVKGWDYGIERPWYVSNPDASFDEIDPTTFDGLLLPGGRAPVYLRNVERCTEVVRHFLDADKPVAAICRGALLIVAAGAKGRRLTGSSLIRPRIALGGCTYVESRGEPVFDGNIVTVIGRPYYHVWIRSFLAMLKGTGNVPRERSA